jgi:hypothetical protein
VDLVGSVINICHLYLDLVDNLNLFSTIIGVTINAFKTGKKKRIRYCLDVHQLKYSKFITHTLRPCHKNLLVSL